MSVLLYCPILYHHDKGMWPPTISSTSYFLWQKNLWDVFERLEDWEVIWNAGQPNSNLYDPIRDWDARNIRYAGMDIGKALRKCDRVLVDVPSTVMWDAKKVGKPCLCVTSYNQWIRFDAQELDIYIIYLNQVEEAIEMWLDCKPEVVCCNKFIDTKFTKNKNDWLKEISKNGMADNTARK